MGKKKGRPRRPALHLTHARAARLYRLVQLLGDAPRARDEVLRSLRVGLRTFYREIELLERVGIRIRFANRRYELRTTLLEVEERLPFPDPLLTFAEMKELAGHTGRASQRLAQLYREVVSPPGSVGPRSRTKHKP